MNRRTRHQLTAGVVLVAAVGVGAVVAPAIQSTAADRTAAPAVVPATTSPTVVSDALRDLQALPVSDVYVPGYDRAEFGQAWADTDHNGCDTRDDVLHRDLVDAVTKPGTRGCVVLSGTLEDPYTGRSIRFVRGATSSMAVQIDHRYPLALAWRHGAAAWTPQQREAFANDQQVNLVAVDGQANREKSASGPGQWMPSNTADRCGYAAAFVTVATTWHLSVGSSDRAALERTLTGCAGGGA